MSIWLINKTNNQHSPYIPYCQIQSKKSVLLSKCIHCNGKMKIIASIKDPPVIKRILTYLGLSPIPPPLAPARMRELFVSMWYFESLWSRGKLYLKRENFIWQLQKISCWNQYDDFLGKIFLRITGKITEKIKTMGIQ